ncbi:D-alanine--D-alanine ligase [Erythrobacter donghaensis]|uniref:D-alanine--D-alanine ligase n=1 Tax=Erythrobacter donghaensis TaxID=267135 RepID=UPI003CCC25AE
MGNSESGTAVSLDKKLHVAVLMGGWANERPVSLTSGAGVADALESKGHKVTRIDMGRDVALRLHEAKPDVVFNALHGVPGEDGTVQGMLDLMGLPYTHSGLATSVIAIDKQLTKQALVPHGIPMPGGRIVTREELYQRDPLPRPYVLKPVNEGSSVGVAIVTADSNVGNPISAQARGPWQEFAELLAEPFIKGRELTAAVLDGPEGPRALGVTELVVANGFYDYENKYTAGRTEHIFPAQLPPEITALCEAYAVKAHQVLGCNGTSRTDFRWDEEAGEDGLFVLETNTQPGMTPLSLVPEQAAGRGIPYADLVEMLVAEALRVHAGKKKGGAHGTADPA